MRDVGQTDQARRRADVRQLRSPVSRWSAVKVLRRRSASWLTGKPRTRGARQRSNCTKRRRQTAEASKIRQLSNGPLSRKVSRHSGKNPVGCTSFLGDNIFITELIGASISERETSRALAQSKQGAHKMQRRRFKNIRTFPDRLSDFAREAREHAEKLPPGPEKDDLLKKARQADTASHVEKWLNSPGLQPPK